MELPEEDYRVAAETKREELNELIAGFNEVNLKERNETDGGERGTGSGKERESGGGGHGAGSPQRKFERPSERRRRLEQEVSLLGGSECMWNIICIHLFCSARVLQYSTTFPC